MTMVVGRSGPCPSSLAVCYSIPMRVICLDCKHQYLVRGMNCGDCPRCQSNQTFDMEDGEWPCLSEYMCQSTANYNDHCAECKKHWGPLIEHAMQGDTVRTR